VNLNMSRQQVNCLEIFSTNIALECSLSFFIACA
jgi:hypothetical protein